MAKRITRATVKAAAPPRSKQHARVRHEPPNRKFLQQEEQQMSKLIGVHVSAAGGPACAVRNVAKLGPFARSFAFFIRPRLTWKPVPPFREAQVTKFHELLGCGRCSPSDEGSGAESPSRQQQVQLAHVVVHASYLINLGSHDPELRAKSIELMLEEVRKCEQLGVPLYVFHPGSCGVPPKSPGDLKARAKARKKKLKPPADQADDEENGKQELADMQQKQQRRRLESIGFVADGVVNVLRATSKVALVVEAMSGQGTTLGATFEELRAILDAVDRRYRQDHEPESKRTEASVSDRVGVCLDTCHVFASGWEMDTPAKCNAMLAAFDANMCPKWPQALKVLHLNDSKASCGSRVDRHANIGHGAIGLSAFRWIMNHKRFDNVPMILETPRPKKKARKTGNMKLIGSADADSSGDDRKPKRKPLKRKRVAIEEETRAYEDDEDGDLVAEDSVQAALKKEEENEMAPSAMEELALLHNLIETGA
uniref:Xylose isomerase-like TIM barrel domain-containing protein n=1 Tax=Globisporangium ultimum (strain ATCC 200006 / CBS 805.95 / DAOM BR144) TaxID=431595 RepID=K3WJA8_GLOUD